MWDFIKSSLKERNRVSPVYQAMAIGVSALIIILSIYLRMDYFRKLDEPIAHESINPQTLRQFGGFPEYVDVGLQIDQFQDFNVTKNLFQFSGNLWFLFESGAVSLKTLENFKFERATIVSRSEPDIQLIGTKLLVRYLIRVSYNTGLNFSDFPLDSHRINLVLTEPFISPADVIFTTKEADFTFTGSLLPFGWRDIGHSVEFGYAISNLSQTGDKAVLQPLVGFSIDIERYGIRFTLSILLPILLLYFLIFFTLSVDIIPSITLALGCITGIVAYRYVIEQLSPMSGDLMLSDYFFFLFLTSAIAIFWLNKLDIMISLNPRFKISCILLIHLFTTSAVIYLLIP